MTDGINQDEKKELNDFEKAANDFKKDMLRYKDEAKSYKDELVKLREELSNKEKARLAEKENWKELYSREKQEKESLVAEITSTKQKFVNSSKINAAVQALGGFKKNDYNKFINVDAIELKEDGSIDPDTLNLEADRIRQTYPELLKSSTSSKLPDEKPSAVKMEQKSFSNMSMAELKEQFSKNK